MNLLLGISRLFASATDLARERTPRPEGVPVTLDDDLLFSDDLPPDAKAVLDAADRAVGRVRADSDRQVTTIRDDAERAIAAIRGEADAAVADVQAAAAKELSPVLRDLFAQLKDMQVAYLRDGRLDEALAVRGRLRALRCDLFGVKEDPGNLSDFGRADAGKVVLFEVVGSVEGSIWGTDTYTGDSRLAVAAVHAGAVRAGERGVVRVTLSDGSDRLFEGSERYGVRSLDYSNYSLGFSVERV